MEVAYILPAVRTAIGKRKAALAAWHPMDRAGYTLDALIARIGLDPYGIEDVIMGCVTQTGEQGLHIGHNAVLASTLPFTVPLGHDRPAMRLFIADEQFAVQAVMSGTCNMVIAARVDSMTCVPMYSQGSFIAHPAPGIAKSLRFERRYPGIAFRHTACEAAIFCMTVLLARPPGGRGHSCEHSAAGQFRYVVDVGGIRTSEGCAGGICAVSQVVLSAR